MAQDNTKPTIQTPSADTTQASAQAKTPEQNQEAIWQQIDVVYNAARKAYLQGSLLPDVIDSFVATLLEIKNTETQSLGGLGADKTQINIDESPDQGTPGETPF